MFLKLNIIYIYVCHIIHILYFTSRIFFIYKKIDFFYLNTHNNYSRYTLYEQ